MKCPNCEHVSEDKALVRCSKCGEAFERGVIEELAHLNYLRNWVEKYKRQIGQGAFDFITTRAGSREDELLAQIVSPKEEIPAPPPRPVIAPTSAAAVAPETTPSSVPITEAKAQAASISPTPKAVTPKLVTKVHADVAGKAKPSSAAKPAVPPKPQRPPIDWKKVRQQIADAATSGALLRALLYLSAFMIVVSATVLVIRFWDNFSLVIQLLFIAAVPISFYIGGWLLRTRLKLIQAGSVLTGIGAVLVAVDFYAVYQFGGLAGRVNGPLYWLLVALLCTALYAFTAWKLQGEFFDYLSLLGGASVMIAITRVLHTPLEWTVASVTLSGAVMTALAGRFWVRGEAWKDFARAARYLSQVLIPASVIYIIFSPAKPPLGQMTAFLFAAFGYVVLTGYFPSIRFAYAALAASMGTVIFGARVFDLALEWYPTVASILALAYLLLAQWLVRTKSESTLVQHYIKALNTTGLVLIGLTLLSGYITVFYGKTWPAVIALAVASCDLAVCAYLFQKVYFTSLASGLFIIPFILGFARWLVDAEIHQPIGWVTAGGNGLALFYIGIGAALRRAEKHGDWLYLWGHIITIVALCVLPFDYLLNRAEWRNSPALVSLGLVISTHLLSFILQDSRKHPSLTKVSSWLPYGLGQSVFLWLPAFLLPLWIAVTWYGSTLPRPWLGATLAGLGLVYLVAGQWLWKRAREYRLPFHVSTYLLCFIGILQALFTYYPLLTALLIMVGTAVILARIYNRVIETTLASVLFVWPVALSLDLFKIPGEMRSFAYVLLASAIYIPIAIYLNRFPKIREHFHSVPVFVVGYALSIYALYGSIAWSLTDTSIAWIGAIVPLIASALYVFSASYFRTNSYSVGWAWATVFTFAITFRQILTLVKIPSPYDALAWAGFAAVYVIVERLLSRTWEDNTGRIKRFWFRQFRWPFIAGAVALSVLSLALTVNSTLAAFRGANLQNYQPYILAQTALVILTIAASRLYQRNWILYVLPILSFLPVTLFFIGYGEAIFGQPLTAAQYALAWAGLGLFHFVAAILTDHLKIRYSQPLYLGAYTWLTWSVFWSLIEGSTLAWTFGIWILAAVISALLVHSNRHKTWDEFTQLLFGRSANVLRTYTRNLFQWLAAWAFPIWCVLFLLQLNVSPEFAWFGMVVPPLGYLGLALWLGRVDRTYTTALYSAAQFYTALVLLISAPVTVRYLFGNQTVDDVNALLAFRILQSIAVVFYAASAWIFKLRSFAHASAWLSIIPFTLAWKLSDNIFAPLALVLPWLAWATVLLAVGFALDKIKTRYSHGPYLAGYVLAIFALIQSTPDRLTNIYALIITTVLALVSYLIVHLGRHHSFEDFFHFFLQKADGTTRQIASTIFLFFACYAAPVLLTQYLAYIKYPLTWRGVSLALAAPLYIAMGLAVRYAKRRSLPTVPTWAFYSTGYALTAIGAMVSFGDERLAIYVLALDAIVYAVSAYIFQQTFWLYLSNVLAPVVALLILHVSGHLKAEWVAWIFMGLAVINLAIGQLFEGRGKGEENVHPFAVPFYMPAFVLSAIALAVASSDRILALQVYSVTVIFYALCGWLFREPLFIYPAAWLAAIPYYLIITLTSLETRWYGLAWLPLILLYIGLGRFVFHQRPLAPLGRGALVQWLTHPAVPFYLLAYALSISMISLSYISPISITIAFGVTTLLYSISAYLFRRPAWLYASLFTAHMTLLTYFTIDPKGGGAHYLSIPFMGLAWIMSLLGFGFTRWITQSGLDEARHDVLKWSIAKHLFRHAWARPFFAFAVFDIFFWQGIALYGLDTTIIVASGFALLLALFSLLWLERKLVYGVVGFGILALGAWMKQSGFSFTNAMAVYSAVGFGLYLLALIFESLSQRFRPLIVWLKPLIHSAFFLTADAALINLVLVFGHMTDAAATLAFAGALYITIAYRGHQYLLGYLGMALLEAAWAMLLIVNDVTQPQWYAIPAGLYFLGVSYLEWHRNRKRYAIGIEILGLGVLLVTSFTQSLNGAGGFPYFVLLMFESLLVIGWGVLQKRKIPFFTGIGASALNIMAQVIVLVSVYDINIWLVALGVGLVIMVIAVYVEFKREQLRARSRELSGALEKWE